MIEVINHIENQQDGEKIDLTLLAFVRKATELSKLWQIWDQLELSNREDLTLAVFYFTQRIVRTSIYESSYVLAHPGIFAALKDPIDRFFIHSSEKFDRKKRQVLAVVDNSVAKFVDGHYQTSEGKIKARTIELAINDLVARATPHGQKDTYNFTMTKEQMADWADKWRPELKSQQG